MSSFSAARGKPARLAISAPLEDARRPAGSSLTSIQSKSLRRLLLLNKAAHRAEVARHASALAASSLGSPAGDANLDRATNALRMYVAWEVVEEIDGALARIETGAYGTCGSCERPITFEYLEASPLMRFCAACGEFEAEPTKSRPATRTVVNGGRR